MSVPNAEKHLTTGKPVPPELLLNIPTVAKVVFGLEPGCVVHYSAIKEKLQLLGPHMQKTTNGPELMNYFAELRKTRNKWAVAFANYQSQMMTKVVLERNLYGRVLTASERSAMPGPAWKVCSESLTIVTQQLLAIKTSREFAEKVRILEACAKQYTAHSRLKAVADRAAIALAQKKQAEAEQAKAALAKQKQEEKRRKQAEARKAKKAAAQAATKATEKNNRIQSVFNPDMPDFAQFMNKFSTVTTSPATNPAGTAGTAASIMGATVAATGSPKPAAKRVSKKTPPAAKLTDAGVKKRPYVRKAGNSPGNRAAVNPSAVQFSVNPSAAQFSVSPAASQSSGNSYTTQSPFNPPVAQFSVNPSASQFSVSPAASQSSGNSYTAQGPFNTPAAQFSVNPSAAQFSVSPAADQSSANSYTTQGPFNPYVVPGSGNNLNTPNLGNVAQVYLSPTDTPYIMEQQDFGDFVKTSGYPLPNCFVGPLSTLDDGRTIYMEHQPRYTPEELQMYNQPGLYPPPTRYVSLHSTESASQGANEIDVPGSPKRPAPAPEMASSTPAPEAIDNTTDMELERAIRAELGLDAANEVADLADELLSSPSRQDFDELFAGWY